MIEIATGTEELLCHIDSRVAVITLNKPHKKNALGDILTPALRETLLAVEAECARKGRAENFLFSKR